MEIKVLKSNCPGYWYSCRVSETFPKIRYRINEHQRFYSNNIGSYFGNDDVVITELPKSFCVKKCFHAKWKRYINWLNKNYNSIFNGCSWDYYGISLENKGELSDRPFGTEIHIEDMIKHIDYMESQQHIKGAEQFSKESQLITKMNKIIKEEEFDLTTNEGRLAYAQKHYPIGTKVISLFHEGNLELIIDSTNFIPARTNGIQVKARTTSLLAVVYENGKWAEIIKEEFDLTTNEGRLAYAQKHYPIGTEFIPLDSEGKSHNNIVGTINYKIVPANYGNLDGGIGFIYANGKWAEIIKEENKMETQKLSRKGLKEIHSVACPNWKDVLEHYGSRNPLEDYIELTQEEVDKMFKACTEEQLPIVSKYLKQDDGSVDVTKFKGWIEDVITARMGGEYENKAFILTHDFNWEIKKDSQGKLCLIPTKKK